MKIISIQGYEAEDIDRQIDKILRGLGTPEPPLCLDDARELLELDRRYYATTSDGFLRSTVNRITVAGKQILKRPSILFDAVRKAELSALWIPDRKRILIDSSKPKLKHRWSEAHEIGHSVIPWHADLLMGDTDTTLSPTCNHRLEAEANYAAGKLLFLGNRFPMEANDLGFNFETICQLAKTFGNTITSTLWRLVEECGVDRPMVGLVSGNPHEVDANGEFLNSCRYFIRSSAFAYRFSNVTEHDLLGILRNYCRQQSGGPLGEIEALLIDGQGHNQVFHFWSFSNKFDVLTLVDLHDSN